MFLNNYKQVSIEKAGILSLASQKSWGAHFEIETDLRPVFPYINAVIPEARFHDQPEYLLFLYDGIHCTLYPHDMIAAPFSGKDSAIAFFRQLAEFLNDLYSRREKIVPNHRKYRPVSVVEVLKLLPRTNCRDCGFPSCMAFAGAMRKGTATPEQCPGFAAPMYEYAVYPVFDNDGKLVSTVTIEKDPERQKEMPDRALEIQEMTSGNDAVSGDDALNEINVSDADLQLGQPPLTDREKEVLRLVAGGATNNGISETLCISPHTVKSHVIHIFNKLGVNDRTQAAVIAAQKNLIK